MELRDLRYFCTAAETEHISKAAEKLGVSQPFLTKIITQLEEELGCELFDHVGRRVKLNRYGKLLLESANKILDEIDLIHSRFESIVDDPDQPLRFAVGSSAYCSDLPLRYMQEFPGSSVSREYMDRPDLIRALEEGRVDFAICSPPISPKESENIVSKAVHTERACLVMPTDHPLAEKEYVELNDLNGLPLITTLKGSDTRNNIDLLCKANNVSPSIIYESIDNNLILNMVSEGLGCTVFAWNYTRLLPPSEHYVIREFSDSCGVIALCRNRHAPMTQAQQRFEEFVMDYFEALADKKTARIILGHLLVQIPFSGHRLVQHRHEKAPENGLNKPIFRGFLFAASKLQKSKNAPKRTARRDKNGTQNPASLWLKAHVCGHTV